jgi:hypothetical protein
MTRNESLKQKRKRLRDTFQKAIETWGEVSQIDMVFEESAELQKELCKHLRGKGNIERISEEIADLEIMLEQMKVLFKIHALVKEYKEFKIARLEGLIEEAVQKRNGGVEIANGNPDHQSIKEEIEK